MTHAQATRECADAARDFLLAVQRVSPFLRGGMVQAMKLFVLRSFLPFAEQIELSARRLEAEEVAQIDAIRRDKSPIDNRID